MPRSVRVLIAGGGVAGAAAACLLGPDCVLVEREAGPHDKICGEFVSTEAVAYLRRLGLDPVALGATPVSRIRLVHSSGVVSAALPFTGYGLSRRVLDEALLQRARAAGAEIVRGHAVRSLEDGVADVGGLGRFPGHAVLLATGKHDLRGAKRAPARKPEDLVGLKMYLRIDPAQVACLAGHIELLLFRGGYGGLQPVEGGDVNLCVLLERRLLLEAGGTWAGVQGLLEAESPHLRRLLRGARALLARPLSIYRVPYGFVHAPSPSDPGNVFRLGDQAGVIPSFAGDGMAMALHSAFRAASAVRTGDAYGYHRGLRRDFAGQVARAGALYRVGRALPRGLALAASLWPGALGLAARVTRVPRWAVV